MKTLTIVSLLLLSLTAFAQSEKTNSKWEVKTSSVTDSTKSKFDVQTSAMKISTDDLEELRTLDWDEMLEAFESNNPDQEFKVTLEFKEKKSHQEDKTTKSISVAATCTSGELQSFKKQLKKLQKKMVASVEKWNK